MTNATSKLGMLPFFTDLTGKALDVGKVYIGTPHTDPRQNPMTVYWDEAQTTPAVQPLATLSGRISNGGVYAEVFLNAPYSIYVEDSRGQQMMYLANVDDPIVAAVGNLTTIKANNIAALRLVDATKNSTVNVLSYYSTAGVPDGGGGAYVYDSTDTTSPDNGGTVIVGLNNARWKLQWFGSVDIKQFGAKADAGTTDNSTVFANARTWIAASPTCNKLRFSSGIYGYSVSPNWAIQNAEIIADGEVHLRYTGTGNAVIIDGGATTGGVFNLHFGWGNRFIIEAPSTAQNGVYCRSVLQGSKIGVQVNGAGTTYAGMEVDFAVCAHFDYVCSNNVQAGGSFYSKPNTGLKLTQRNAGELTSYCTFVNPIIEGVAASCALLDYAQGNVFIGGTMEGSGSVGANLTANAIKNKFFGTDFEANHDHDVYCLGNDNEFYGINSAKIATFDGTAKNNSLIGGTFQDILYTASTFGNVAANLVYNQNATAGAITDTPKKNAPRSVRNVAQSNIENVPLSTTALTVSGGTFSYTNASFTPQYIIVTGSNITGIQITHGGGVTAGLTVAVLYPLSPGDTFAFNYSGATPGVNMLTQ